MQKTISFTSPILFITTMIVAFLINAGTSSSASDASTVQPPIITVTQNLNAATSEAGRKIQIRPYVKGPSVKINSGKAIRFRSGQAMCKLNREQSSGNQSLTETKSRL